MFLSSVSFSHAHRAVPCCLSSLWIQGAKLSTAEVVCDAKTVCDAGLLCTWDEQANSNGTQRRTIPCRRTKQTEEQQKRRQDDGCSEFQLSEGEKTQGEEEFFFFSWLNMHVPGLIQPECVLDGGGRKHQGKASLEKVVPGQAAQLQLVHIQLHYSTQFNSIWLNKMIFCAFWRWTFQTDHAFSSTHFFWQLQGKVQKSERRFNRATISLNNINQDSVPEYQSVIAKTTTTTATG